MRTSTSGLLFIGLVLAPAVMPAQAVAAKGCPGNVDFFAVRAYDGVSCARVKAVQNALYRRGFNAVGGSRQVVEVRGRAWRCVWRDGERAPGVRCENLEGRGVFRASLSVG